MPTAVVGSYLLRLKFGDTELPVEPSNIDSFVVVQDMNKFLPSFRIRLEDTSGILTHVAPFDRKMSVLSLEIGPNINQPPDNSFDFLVFRRFPESQYNVSSLYDISGLLNTALPLFGPDYCRSFKNKTIKDVLSEIAFKELNVDSVDISKSLEYTKLILQPHWTNSQFLNDLMRRTIGKNGESCFKCFIYRKNRKSVFVFKTLAEMVSVSKPAYKFIVNDEPYQDFLPIYDMSIVDNYRIFGILGSKRQAYGYFDYFENKYIQTEEDVQNVYSLTDYFLIDSNDSLNSDPIIELGRSNDWTLDFKGHVRSAYYNRIYGLCKVWILTWGLTNIVPGDLVLILFHQGVSSGEIYTYQYSGYWLVERVVHTFGDSHRTKLLLTRTGVDTDKSTTLLKAKLRR